MTTQGTTQGLDLDELRAAIRAEYAAVAEEPDRGFHFHTVYRLAAILGSASDSLRLALGPSSGGATRTTERSPSSRSTL